MKRLIALILALLLPCAALAEFDIDALKADANLSSFVHPGTLNTVYRPLNQPYRGQVDESYEGDLDVYVDYISLVDQGVTLLRLMVSTVAYDLPLNADQLRITIGGKRYTFTVTHEESEYDGLYMEDFSLCLTDASLPLLKAIAQQKKDDPVPVELLALGETVFSGIVRISGAEAAQLYDTFVDLGGKRQELKWLDDKWPCKIEKVK